MKKLPIFLIIITSYAIIAFFSCKRDLPPEPLPPPPLDTANRTPYASAGFDQTTMLPKDTVLLDGSASWDPDGNISAYLWSNIAGPGPCVITDPASDRTVVKNLVEGIYQFELTVTDDEGSIGKDVVEVFVVKAWPGACNGSYLPFNISITGIGSLSDARVPAVAATGSKIVFAGGTNRIDENCSGMWCNTLPSSAIDIYDVYSHTWSITQLSQARQGIGAVSCGNKLFFAGGSNFELYFNNGTVYDNVDMYDVSTNTWTVAHLSLPRSYVTAAVLANKVFFAGGTEDGMNGSTRVDVYDIPTNSWSIGELSVPRYFIDAVVDDNKIYFIGGESWDEGGDISRIIDIYDASTNSWSTSTLEQQYYAITDVVVGNDNYWIYYSGASHVKIKNMTTGAEVEGCAPYPYSGTFSINNDIIFPADNLSSVTVYNTITGQWSVGTMLQALPSWAPIVSLNNILYTGGGLLGNYVYANKVYALNW